MNPFTTFAASAVATLLGSSLLSAQDISILALGDSITAGFAPDSPETDYVGDGGYLAPLAADLNGVPLTSTSTANRVTYDGSVTDATTTSYLNVINQLQDEGHGGYSINDIDANLTGLNVYQAYTPNPADTGYYLNGGHGTGRGPIDPNYIVLNIGTNDAYGENPTQMLAALQSLLNDLKNDYVGMPGGVAANQTLTNTQIIVSDLTPRTDDVFYNGTTDYEATEAAYNAGIPALVAAEDTNGFDNFHFVDVDATFPADGLATDHVHPSPAGYDQLGLDYANEIESLEAASIPEPRTSSLFLAGACLLVGFYRRTKRSPEKIWAD